MSGGFNGSGECSGGFYGAGEFSDEDAREEKDYLSLSPPLILFWRSSKWRGLTFHQASGEIQRQPFVIGQFSFFTWLNSVDLRFCGLIFDWLGVAGGAALGKTTVCCSNLLTDLSLVSFMCWLRTQEECVRDHYY